MKIFELVIEMAFLIKIRSDATLINVCFGDVLRDRKFRPIRLPDDYS